MILIDDNLNALDRLKKITQQWDKEEAEKETLKQKKDITNNKKEDLKKAS